MRENRQLGEVGDIWRLTYGKGLANPYHRHYLVLKVYSDKHYYFLYRCLCLEENDVVPDLILDNSTQTRYDAQKVA